MTFRMDPRAKLYLLLLANLMLLFHVGTGAEAAATALCLLLFFLSGKARAGVRLSVLYFGLLAVDLFVVPRAGESVLLNLLSLVSVGVRMMLPCIITGAYAFSTTTVGELTAALTKGIGLPGRHTCMTELRLTAWDFLYPALCTLPLLWKVVTLL